MAIDFITDQLALGGLADASSKILIAARIDFVLSLAPDVEVEGPRQVFLPVADREPMSGALIEQAVRLIDTEISAGRRVLIHCSQGISRSPAIAVCYLYQCHEMSVSSALEMVRRARPQAAPHPALLASIVEYYDSDWPSGYLVPVSPGSVMKAYHL